MLKEEKLRNGKEMGVSGKHREKKLEEHFFFFQGTLVIQILNDAFLFSRNFLIFLEKELRKRKTNSEKR